MITRKNILFCIISVVIIVSIGSFAAWILIIDSNCSENDLVSSYETQMESVNLIAAINGTQNMDQVYVEDTAVKYLKRVLNSDLGNYSQTIDYLSFSGIANVDPYWTVKIKLAQGLEYGLEIQKSDNSYIVTNACALVNDEYSQKLVLTANMQSYLDQSYAKLNSYYEQSNTYQEINFEPYYDIVYNPYLCSMTYEQVKQNGLADILGITDANAKDQYTQEELTILLNNAVDKYYRDLPDYNASNVTELNNEITNKIRKYKIDRWTYFRNNKDYNVYSDYAMTIFKRVYGDKVSEYAKSETYLDVTYNNQDAIVVRIDDYSNTYYMILGKVNKNLLRIALTDDILEEISSSQSF